MILTEFDESKRAVINPDMILDKMENFPKTVISVFSYQLFDTVVEFLGGVLIAETHDVDGVWPVYEVFYKGKRFGFCKARLGAPACVGLFEEIVALGAKRIILLGNCGVLEKSIEDCGIIIPTKAIRDEGTSYHYAPAQAFADFRGIEFFQFLYAGDNLAHSAWDPRSLSGNVRLDDKQKIALLAFELACRIWNDVYL